MKRALANDAHPQGPAYWKVEALAAIPGNVLLFGIREVGESYKVFEYSVAAVMAVIRQTMRRISRHPALAPTSKAETKPRILADISGPYQ